MNGEEVGAEGRAFGHLMDGTSYELPRLGKFSWENSVAHPATGNRTVVIGLDDSTPGEVYVYVGNKTGSGSPVDRAGLTNGNLYGIVVTGFPAENVDSGIPNNTRFTLFDHGNVENTTGAQLQAADTAAGVTKWNRPEDGAWDPLDPRSFYFVTTASFSTRSRLWRLRFDDINDVTRGGVVEVLLDGTEGQKMMDNMTAARNGDLYIQEDPGNQPYLARIWRYIPSSDTLIAVAEHDPVKFGAGAAGAITNDEESSGIIDVSDILGAGWFLLNVQAHKSLGGELVEDGQLLLMRTPAFRLFRRR